VTPLGPVPHVVDGPREIVDKFTGARAWLAFCSSCGKGIRCNERRRALEFLRAEGCLP